MAAFHNKINNGLLNGLPHKTEISRKPESSNQMTNLYKNLALNFPDAANPVLNSIRQGGVYCGNGITELINVDFVNNNALLVEECENFGLHVGAELLLVDTRLFSSLEENFLLILSQGLPSCLRDEQERQSH